jgi:hypothetical protein
MPVRIDLPGVAGKRGLDLFDLRAGERPSHWWRRTGGAESLAGAFISLPRLAPCDHNYVRWVATKGPAKGLAICGGCGRNLSAESNPARP